MQGVFVPSRLTGGAAGALPVARVAAAAEAGRTASAARTTASASRVSLFDIGDAFSFS